MKKDQYFEKHRHQQIAQQELERKWKVFCEQEELQKLYEAAQRAQGKSGYGSAGGFSIQDNTINDYVENDYVENYF